MRGEETRLLFCCLRLYPLPLHLLEVVGSGLLLRLEGLGLALHRFLLCVLLRLESFLLRLLPGFEGFPLSFLVCFESFTLSFLEQ